MLPRFKWLFGIYGIGALVGLGVILFLYPLLGIPSTPGYFMFLGVLFAFFVIRLFIVAGEELTTVRCGLFGHKMLNVRLDQGVRTYKCKRKRCLETERRVA